MNIGVGAHPHSLRAPQVTGGQAKTRVAMAASEIAKLIAERRRPRAFFIL